MKIKNEKRNEIVVYTAILGDYDDLKNEEVKIPGCDFICFTDDHNLRSNLFNIVLCKRMYRDQTRDNRLYKILPHKFLKNYEYSLYIDGSVLVKTKNIIGLVKKYLKYSNLAVFSHPERDCIYDEAVACIKAKKDKKYIIEKQIRRYKKEGYPEHNGLTENTILLRRHNAPDIISLGEAWWKEVDSFSKRDQLSFNYVAWRNKFNFTIMDGFLWDVERLKYNNRFFKVESHKHASGNIDRY